VCERARSFSESRVLLILLVFGFLFGVLVPICSAAARPEAATQDEHFRLVGTALTGRVHPAHSKTQTTHPQPLIEQVRFNQRVLSLEQGVTVGPGVGELEIQFAAPASAASDRLRYRLRGFDAGWEDAGKERQALYSRLPPGHYEFDCEEAEIRSGRILVEESLPIVVIPHYWQTGWLRSLCTIFLLFLILVLHKLRVSRFARHAQKLQESLNQTKLELHLAAKRAGDAQQALEEQALKDSLTGLWNRRALFSLLEKEVCRAQRDHLPVTLVMIDMDHFKNINDTYGHPTGDAVLRETASRLLDVLRPYDFAGRYGGEEFLIVLPSCSAHNGMQRAEGFRRAIVDRPIPTAVGPLTVTCSLGVAMYDEAITPEELIHRADEALYRAKRQGRNSVCAEV
jgi:diguanylate cyclase (GGDEF)-like protein